MKLIENFLTADSQLANLVFSVSFLISAIIGLVSLFSHPPYGFFLGAVIVLVTSHIYKKRKYGIQKKNLRQMQKKIREEKNEEDKINKRFEEMNQTINAMIKKGDINKNLIITRFTDLIPSEMYSSKEEKENLVEDHIKGCLKELARKEQELRGCETSIFLARSHLQRKDAQVFKSNLQKIDDLFQLTPVEFEKWTRRNIFEKEGWSVEETRVTGDGGIDLVLNKIDEHSIAQCKRYRNTVGEPLIRDFYGTMMSEGVSRGYFVTTGLLSIPALKFIKNKPIIVIDRRVLATKYLK